MSRSWPVVTLGDVARHRKEFVQIQDGLTYRRCRVQLHARGVVLRDEVSGAEIKTKSQQLCRADELLVAEIDAKVGGYGIVPVVLDGAIVSSHYFLFELDRQRLDHRYLAYFLRTADFRDQVRAQGSTNYAAVRPRDVLSYRVPLPPLEVQRDMVGAFSAACARVDEARETRASALDDLGALKRVLRNKAFSRQLQPRMRLDSACAAIIDNLHSNPVYEEEGPVACVRSPDVGWGALNLSKALRTSEAEYARRTVRGEPQADDLVFVREGGGTGKCALVRTGERFSLGQRVMMLRPDVTRVRPRFLLQQLLSPTVQDEQIAPLVTGSAAPHLNISDLRALDIYVPDLAEQARVEEQLAEVDALLDAATKLSVEMASEVEAVIPSILARAFSGPVDQALANPVRSSG